MSVLLNFGPPSQAASARLKIMIDEKRSEEKSEVDNRITERLVRHAVAVGEIDAQRIAEVDAAKRQRGEEGSEPAHAHDIGQQARGKEDEGIKQHLQLRIALAVRHRQHRTAGP